MDSLTHLVLSGVGAAALTPQEHRRAALLAGMALGTLPDVDVFVINVITADPILRMVYHRSFSHSLFIMPLVVVLIWWLFKKQHGRVRAAPWRWLCAMQCAVISHLLLDALTVYGTQLSWPFMPHPTMWSTLFIIDPLYTAPLLIACLVAWCASKQRWSQYVLVGALLISSCYIGWSYLAKRMVEQAAHDALITLNLADAPRFSTPLPFNSLLWRVVVLTPTGYLIGDRSVIADTSPMRFHAFPSDIDALVAVNHLPAVRQLQWFNRGFMKAEVINDTLFLKDLRMGVEPDYIFNFAVAKRINGHWQAIPPRQVETTLTQATIINMFKGLYQRIWNEHSTY